MDGFIEIGDIAPKIDIPAEITKLIDDNQMLKAKNSKQKTVIGILVVVLFGAGIYILKNNTNTKKEMTE